MNKSDFIAHVSKKYKITNKETNTFFKRFLDSIEEILHKGDSVNIAGFGNWSVVKRKARNGHNPRTGEEVKIPEYNQAIFKSSKRLKDIVNNKA